MSQRGFCSVEWNFSFVQTRYILKGLLLVKRSWFWCNYKIIRRLSFPFIIVCIFMYLHWLTLTYTCRLEYVPVFSVIFRNYTLVPPAVGCWFPTRNWQQRTIWTPTWRVYISRGFVLVPTLYFCIFQLLPLSMLEANTSTLYTNGSSNNICII